jgi:hypothetical protein
MLPSVSLSHFKLLTRFHDLSFKRTTTHYGAVEMTKYIITLGVTTWPKQVLQQNLIEFISLLRRKFTPCLAVLPKYIKQLWKSHFPQNALYPQLDKYEMRQPYDLLLEVE